MKFGPMEMGLILVILPIYFLPVIIAIVRHHPNLAWITLLNIFLGWTFIGWLAALVLAFISKSKPLADHNGQNSMKIAEERLACGEISAKEFDEIKQRLS